jgi:glycine cleavage system aminomethyltransferase T
LQRPKVKEADFRGKAKHLEYKARAHQPAMLCTLVMTENTDEGRRPLPDGRHSCRSWTRPDRQDVAGLSTRLGRRSFTTSCRLRPDDRQEHRARLPASAKLK